MHEPVVFRNGGQAIHGSLHVPGAPHEPPFPALVMLHGFTGNRIESHRLFVKAARRFADDGILALRFDFRGCGESDGDFEDLTVDGEMADARAALEFVRRRDDVIRDRVGLLGFSFGGAIAACVAAAPGADVRCLVLWAAVADLRRAFTLKATERIVSDFGRRPVHDLHGNALSQRLLDELFAFRPAERAAGWRGPALVVHGAEDRGVPPDDAARWREALSRGGEVEVRMIEGAGHTFAGLAWEADLLETTARFLARRLAG
ncbi:MAG: alpha/beta hydrolase [bacterium]|nr:alpha/beta hydrolase [bacterium]